MDMGKVITSAGLPAFAESGAYETVKDHQSKTPNEAAPLEIKADVPISDLGQKGKETTPKADTAPKAPAPDPDDGLEPDERKDLTERIRKIVGKKHAEMKAAETLARKRADEAADAERFAESQYNERKLAEQRAQALQDRLQELEAKAQPVADPDEGKPKITQFQDASGQVDWDKFTDAKAEWAANKKVREYEQKLANERVQAENDAVKARVKESAAKARKAHADFDEVMSSVKGTAADQVPQYMLNYLSESENAGEVAYYLAKNPEESARIAKLSPIRGLAEMGKLEDKITAKQPVPERGGTPPLPTPITPLDSDGTAGINTDPSKMSYKELRAYERAKRGSRN